MLVLCLISLVIRVQTRTQADTLNAKFGGEFALLKAAFDGDLQGLQSAILQHPNIDCILTQEIGERYLKLGKVGIDFPVAPPLHLAISGGTTNHLRVAHRLILAGADVNYFNFSTQSNFPPPIYFALGAFSFPTPAHAGLLDAIFQTYAASFRYASIATWVRVSGYPPPLHTCTFFNNIDGIYVLSTLPNYDMDERDNESLTALHAAAWLGNFVQISFLLQKGADPLAKDFYNRTFLHYCAIRGIASIPIKIFNQPSAISASLKNELVEIKDNDGNTALDIAKLSPSQTSFIDVMEAQSDDRKSEACESWKTILSLDAVDLTPSNFWRNFQITQRPLKIIGNFTSSLHIWSIISNCTAFTQRYGSVIVSVVSFDPIDNIRPLSSHPDNEIIETFFQGCYFWNRSASNLPPRHMSVATAKIPPTSSGDFTSASLDHFFEGCLHRSPIELRMSSGHITGTSLRSHSAAWNVLLLGRTRTWYFLSPGTALDLMISLASNETKQIPMGLDLEDPLKPELSPQEWVKRVLPFLRKNKLVATIRQRLGDVIYIPHGWSYVIVGSSDAIETTTPICESSSQSIFHQVPVGHRLYGNLKKN
jgi:hypothetical protein